LKELIIYSDISQLFPNLFLTFISKFNQNLELEIEESNELFQSSSFIISTYKEKVKTVIELIFEYEIPKIEPIYMAF
jgi:hypothetical protein